MRILVTTIPFTGMKIDAHISQTAINARLQEGSTANTIIFEEPPIADLTLTRMHGGVMVKGIVSARCKQDCGSCGDLVSHEALAQVDWILQSPTDRAAPDDDLDDPGVIVYDGEHVDLEEHLQEALILSLSPFWKPPLEKDPVSAKEKCSFCKKDCSKHKWSADEVAPTKESSHTRSFGDLLQGAIKSSTEKKK
jgi:uncharacterized metal-binding protein YceD (DUF177 family)